MKENDYAIWTVSRFGDTAHVSLGWRVRVLPYRRIFDSLVADFCRNFADRPLVFGRHPHGLSRQLLSVASHPEPIFFGQAQDDAVYA